MESKDNGVTGFYGYQGFKASRACFALSTIASIIVFVSWVCSMTNASFFCAILDFLSILKIFMLSRRSAAFYIVK
jgi:hypothetical protein